MLESLTQQGTEVLIPTALEEPSPVDTHPASLEVDLASV